jgi:hypothetical protein
MLLVKVAIPDQWPGKIDDFWLLHEVLSSDPERLRVGVKHDCCDFIGACVAACVLHSELRAEVNLVRVDFVHKLRNWVPLELEVYWVNLGFVDFAIRLIAMISDRNQNLF